MKNNTVPENKNLAGLSRHHYNGLLIVGKIRRALRCGVAHARISTFILLEFESRLEPHLIEEEEWLLPKLPAENPLRVYVEQQHAELRRMVKSFSDFPDKPSSLPEEFANMLEEHIRFEERTLFPFIEKHISEQGFKTMDEQTSNITL